jgi:lysyl-tRNA synthetase class 2
LRQVKIVMSSEETLIQVRQKKHQHLNGGVYPLASDKPGCSVQSVLEDIDRMTDIKTTLMLNEVRDTATKTLRGRISALRKSGALTFLNLTDETGHIQLVATRNNLYNYDNLKLLDLGDIVEVTGEPVLTKTGERSILISEWRVLAKSHRPPPEKFVGITDTELKYRKRYLDLMSSEESRARFMIRGEIIHLLRGYMRNQGFREVETSTLSSIASGANAKPFVTHHNALDIEMCLRVAPELNLKRLLVGGFGKVYEIGRAYRNEGIDTRHNPEFTIMESYEAYGNFPRLIDFTKNMLREIDTQLVMAHVPEYVRDQYQAWCAERPFTLHEFHQITMFDAVVSGMRKASMDLRTLQSFGQIDILDTTNPRFQKIDLKTMMHELDTVTSEGERLAVLFEHVAEPFLTEDYRTEDGNKSVPVFITEYPKEISPLARSNDANPKITDRFELFVEGRELCNAFQELNDPGEQAVRFMEQLANRNEDAMEYDADYVEALEYGMPPAIGFGMGIERLCMLLTNTNNIKDVILFPTLRPVS